MASKKIRYPESSGYCPDERKLLYQEEQAKRERTIHYYSHCGHINIYHCLIYTKLHHIGHPPSMSKSQ